MGARSDKSRKKSPLPPSKRAYSNGDKDSQMLLSSNASSKGSALERTGLPVSRRNGQLSPSNGTEQPLEKQQGSYSTQPKLNSQSKGLSPRDKQAMALLIILCLFKPLVNSAIFSHPSRCADFIQGIPIGLAFGSIPFLLKSRLSYSQIGIFSLR